MTVIAMILTCSFGLYVDLLKQVSEVNQLKEILRQVAATAAESIDMVAENGAALSVVIRLPLRVGSRDYWLRFSNDSSSAWLEGAFGVSPRSEEQEYRVYLPQKVKASGTFEGRYGLAQLSCSLSGSVPQITLSLLE